MTLLQGNLQFYIDCAKDLPNTDWKEWTGSDFTDPFVIGSIGEKELFRTKHIHNTLNPVWNHEVLFELDKSTPKDIKIEVYDWDRFSADDPLGRFSVPYADAMEMTEPEW